ncbi:MAG TPA: choice-of-anchor D domain-containing protein [Candidatus Kapabacteria bacterium]|nr:choice-of-anchor D domain-containing protein [Candidatus Kapabacteria bacterium]
MSTKKGGKHLAKTAISFRTGWSVFFCLQIAVIFSLVVVSDHSYASWKKLAQFGSVIPQINPTVNSCFFFNDMHGFAGIDGVTGIMRTYDGGRTWQPCVIPAGYGAGFINDIFMSDSLNGWAVIEDDISEHGLWRTTDGGVTWVEDASFIGAPSSVHQTSSKLYITSRYSIPTIGVSLDGGASFLRLGSDWYNDINFVDDNHAVASAFRSSNGSYANSVWTMDAGLTWFTNNVFIEAWSVYAKKGTPTFIIAGEKKIDDGSFFTNVTRSDDYGRTWGNVGVIPGRTTGTMHGVGDVLYTQSWTSYQFPNSIKGIMRSIDGGHSWASVGGPSNFRDTRFWVGNCHGRTIIVFDEWGGVWRSDDGGDGLLGDSVRNPFLNPGMLDLASDVCTSTIGLATFYQLSCKSLLIENISFVDSSDEAIKTGALTITSQPAVSSLLRFGQLDSLSFSWKPALLTQPKAKTTFLIRIHSIAEDSSAIFDTVLAVSVASFAHQPVFTISDTALAFDSVNICSATVDTLVKFINQGCDTMKLMSATLVGALDWELLNPNGTPYVLPVTIPVDSTGSFKLRFTPHQTGTTTASLILHFIQNGVTKDTTIFLSGSAYRVLSVFADPSIHFPSLSVCATMDTVITVHNSSCDALSIDSLSNSDGASFEILSNISLPILIQPDSTLSIRVRFHPQKNTSSTGQIRYVFHEQTDSGSATTNIAGIGTSGAAIFTTSIHTPDIHFADRVSCSSPDSISFTISNPGCDTITINSAKLSEAGGMPFSYTISSTFPDTLPGGNKQSTVTVRLDSTNAGSYDGFLDIRFTLPDGTTHDTTLHISVLVTDPPHQGHLEYVSSTVDTLAFCSSKFDTIVIVNDACSGLNISSITGTSGDYSIVSQPKLPAVIQRYGKDTIVIVVNPTNTGLRSTTIQIQTDDNLAPLKSVAYNVFIRPVDQVNFRIEQVNKGTIVADTALIDFIPDLDWQNKGLQDISFILQYNGDLLTYSKTQLFSAVSILTTPAALPNKQEQLTVQIHSQPPSEIVLQKNQPFLRFYFTTALTDTTETSVQLSSLQINNGDPIYNKCNLISSGIDGDFALQLMCGGTTLQNFLEHKQIIFSQAPHPDPASANSTIIFPFSLEEKGIVVLSIHDALGREVLTQNISAASAGEYNFSVTSNMLSSGAYNYVLTYTGSLTGSARGRFVVLQ